MIALLIINKKEEYPMLGQAQSMYGSHHWQVEYLHNCPYCRCTKQAPQSLYWTSRDRPVDCLPQIPFTLTFPPKQGNIVFSYLSPPKTQRHRSQGRFSTKRYKNQHFPQIGKIKDEDTRFTSTLASRNKNQPREIQKVQNTQPQSGSSSGKGYLKKQGRKSDLSSSPKLNSSSNQAQKLPIRQDPKATPIQYLKLITSNSPQPPKQEKQGQEIRNIVNPQRIRYLNTHSADIQQRIPQGYQRLQINQSKSDTNPNAQNANNNTGTQWKGKRIENLSIASSIAEELHLNYDYYFPPDETDQSLSIGIDL